MDSEKSIILKEKIWNGSVKIKILFDLEDGGDKKEFLVNIPRLSYFPVYFDSIVSYFKIFVVEILHSPVWLAYEDVPIKWNLPVGVLYDNLFLPSRLMLDQTRTWTLDLKYKQYPEEHIIPFIYKNEDDTINYIRSVEEVLINQLKQSCYVMCGNSKPIMTLSQDDTTYLLESIRTHNLKLYGEISKKIRQNLIQKIPMKIYISGTNNVINAPVDPKQHKTIESILQTYLPNLLRDKVALVYIHGINADDLLQEEESDLVEIWQYFKYLDNFLYVIIIANN